MLSWWASWEGSVIWVSKPHQLSNLCFLRFFVSYLALFPWRQELTRVCLYCNLHPLQQCLAYSRYSINILWVSKWVDGLMVCLSLWGQISGRLGPACLSVKWAPWPTHPGVLGDLRGWTSALAWCVTNARGMIAGSVTIISCPQDTGGVPSDQKGKFRFSDAIGLDSMKPPNLWAYLGFWHSSQMRHLLGAPRAPLVSQSWFWKSAGLWNPRVWGPGTTPKAQV